jgi:mono/diheme cytochrome c family protein
MRRFVSTASAVALTILVACGGGDADPATQTPEAQEPAPPAGQPQQAAPMDLPAGVTAEMVAEGDAIFHGVGICQTCHGPDATGVGNLAPNLTDGTWLNISGRNYDEIVTVVTSGVPEPKEAAAPMPAKGGANLTDEQVRAVAAYVYTLSQ